MKRVGPLRGMGGAVYIQESSQEGPDMAQHNPDSLPYLLIVLGGTVIGLAIALLVIGH